MSIPSFLYDFFTVPTCPGCRKPLGHQALPLCEFCLAEWQREKVRKCPDCGRETWKCDCLPPLLSESGRIGLSVFLTSYRTGGGSVPDRILYRIKEERDKRLFRFLAKELSEEVFRKLEMRKGKGEICIVPLPRRRGAIAEHGFDQAVELGRALSAELDLPIYPLLSRNRGGREQKELSKEERRENSKRGFSLSDPEKRLPGSTVLLLDDIITTGSGMQAGSDLLFSAGAFEVIPVTVAKTF